MPETTALPRLDATLAGTPAVAGRSDIAAPTSAQLRLPERAVQFGTGAFLRGFVDHFIDAANRRGQFNGRVVAIGSTGSGRDEAINEQDGLYTLVVQGLEQGEARRELRVIGAVSRALSAADDWSAVLACARNPWLEVVFSNTTEVGIALDEGDDPAAEPPRSFPGKLTRFLYERARTFAFSANKGVVVVPCELIDDNGDRLREIVLMLAERWGLGPTFTGWVSEAVPFCNTLVDRIVPGAPSPADREALERELGYRDELLTTCETYRLFAIQGDDALRARLGFAGADAGIVVTDDVRPYRERKVRLLNGTHTITVPLALLAGFATVREAVSDQAVGAFVRRAMLDDIVPTVEAPGAAAFAAEVLDRFANPYIRHALFDITLHGTTKMRVRVVPSIVRYAARTGCAPPSLALGFAAYLEFMRGELQAARRAAGQPVPVDDPGERVRALWSAGDGDVAALVRRACADEALWGTDLTRVPGFVAAVIEHLGRIRHDGIGAALEAHLAGAPAHAA